MTTAGPAIATPRTAWASRLLSRGRDLGLAGALGAVFGLYFYVETVRTNRLWVRDALAGALIGGAIGFALNAAESFRDGAWLKLSRKATWGAVVGAAGGAAGLLIGESVLGGFRGGLLGRAVSWAILGLGIGAGQGVADRSVRRLGFGLLGGGLGGFLGGLCFEALRDGLGNRYDLSQGLGMVILGGGLGLCLALVENVLGRVWVQVLSGRQEGRSYLLADRTASLGLDEHAAVGIFGDPEVARRHAEIERGPSGYRLHDRDGRGRTRVNGVVVAGTSPLRDGDRIQLGGTILVFCQRDAR